MTTAPLMPSPDNSPDPMIPFAAEYAVCGALLVKQQLYMEVINKIKRDDFGCREAFQVFHAFEVCMAEHHTVDHITLTSTLQRLGYWHNGVTEDTLHNMTQGVPNVNNLRGYIQDVREGSLRRMMRTESQSMSGLAEDSTKPIGETLEGAMERLMQAHVHHNADFIWSSERASKAVESLIYSGDWQGVSVGFPSLTRMTYGYQKGTLNIVGARPSVGKTSFGLNCTLSAVASGSRAMFISVEMSVERLMMRAMGIITGIPLRQLKDAEAIRNAPPLHDAVQQTLAQMRDMPLHFSSPAVQSATQAVSNIRTIHRQYGLDIVFVDYLQKLNTQGSRYAGNRVQEVAEICRLLTFCARELNLPIVALAQLSRGAGKKKDRRDGSSEIAEPQLDDLKESGAMEQDADTVLLLHTAEELRDAHGHITDSTIVANLAKNRDDEVGRFRIHFERTTQRMTERNAAVGSAEFGNIAVPGLEVQMPSVTELVQAIAGGTPIPPQPENYDDIHQFVADSNRYYAQEFGINTGE